MDYIDYFVETAFEFEINNMNELKETHPELFPYNLHISNTPKTRLSNGSYLLYLRVGKFPEQDGDLQELFKETCARAGFKIVARSFEELWQTYGLKGDYFQVDVVAYDGEGQTYKTRKPLAALRDGEAPIDGIVRPPSVFMGGPSFEYKLGILDFCIPYVTHLTHLKTMVEHDNELTLEQKRDIGGYLGAIDAILTQSAPDKMALDNLANLALKYLKELGKRVGSKFLIDEIINWLDLLISFF
ncbi:hypothetical protein [Celeribacter sp.]|uniref:hypothetical protein n=1 Tax=Celeribacter sp. TaxID=1890673 RepID=UPI003A8E3870